ncbi:transposase [Streptomyces sp. NPDC056069]|uniref:transposase n=1 Tax=Streptomyces sp. NPDC056069 TaxID=3345702 RepID=UPI0035E0FB33
MLALIRRTLLPQAGFGAVDRATRSLGLKGVVRGRRPRTTIPNPADPRAPDLLDRDFTAPAPNRKWITDFTYVRTYQSFICVAFIVDCFSQKIVSRHASVKRDVELVDVPLRMALWRRGHEGTPIRRGQLIHHSDAGSQGGFNRSSQHLMIMEVRDSPSSAGSGSGGASEAEVSRSSEVPAACRGGVLGGDREGPPCRGGCWHYRRGSGGRDTLVPPVWRYAAVRCEALFGQVPVVS